MGSSKCYRARSHSGSQYLLLRGGYLGKGKGRREAKISAPLAFLEDEEPEPARLLRRSPILTRRLADFRSWCPYGTASSIRRYTLVRWPLLNAVVKHGPTNGRHVEPY